MSYELIDEDPPNPLLVNFEGTVIEYEQIDGGWRAYAPSLGMSSDGVSKREALFNLQIIWVWDKAYDKGYSDCCAEVDKSLSKEEEIK